MLDKYKCSVIRWYRHWHLFSYLRCRLQYVKFTLCITIVYFLNLLTGFQYSMWPNRSFQDEYHLTITHIDIRKIEENEGYLGPSKYILPNSYLISNKYLCGKDDLDTMKQPHLLIFVKSAIENKEVRQAIRMTWGDKHRLEQHGIKLAFVLGKSQFNISIEQEARLYEDIIQIDKIDGYYYTTYKTVMTLRWMTNHCLSKSLRSPYNDIRNYVLFLDDDYYLHVDSLVEYLKLIDENKEMTLYERQTFITGHIIEFASPKRYLFSRYYISMNDYPYDRYPPFPSGGCILMSRYNARLFYIASKYIRLFRLDDVYIGLLAYSMSIRLIKNNKRFGAFDSRINLNQKHFLPLWNSLFGGEINKNETSICVHGYRGKQVLNIWNKLHKTN